MTTTAATTEEENHPRRIGSNIFMSLKTISEPNPLGSTSTIPVPVMTSTESLRANGLERNTSIWYLLKHNWRQLTSLTPGEQEIEITIIIITYSNVYEHQIYQGGFLYTFLEFLNFFSRKLFAKQQNYDNLAKN